MTNGYWFERENVCVDCMKTLMNDNGSRDCRLPGTWNSRESKNFEVSDKTRVPGACSRDVRGQPQKECVCI